LNIKETAHHDLFFTENSLIERIKSDLAKIKINMKEYHSRIKTYRKKIPRNQQYYSFDLELDFSEIPIIPFNIDDRWYYYKAYHYLKLGLFKREDSPIYWVDLKDLSSDIISALSTFDAETRKYILKEAVSRIFEDINFDFYHHSISINLKVVFR